MNLEVKEKNLINVLQITIMNKEIYILNIGCFIFDLYPFSLPLSLDSTLIKQQTLYIELDVS